MQCTCHALRLFEVVLKFMSAKLSGSNVRQPLTVVTGAGQPLLYGV